MAEMVPNDMEFDMFSKLQTDNEVQSRDETSNPKVACIKQLVHPPSAIPGFNGLPTNDARTQVVLKYRNLNLSEIPIIFDSESGTFKNLTTPPPNIAILSLNSPRVNGIQFVNTALSGIWYQDVNNVYLNTSYNWKNWQDDANLVRPIGKSCTTYLNATAFNDTGVVVCEQFNPSILFAGDLLSFSQDMPNHFFDWCHCMFKLGYIKQVKGGYVAIHKRPFPNYVMSEIKNRLELKTFDEIELDPSTTIQVLNLSALDYVDGVASQPVPDLTQTLQNSERSYAGKAREGNFTVQRLNTVSPRWMSTSNINRETNGFYQCYTYFIGPDGVSHFVPIQDKTAAGTTGAAAPILFDSQWSTDMTFSWTQYRGLSYTSAPATILSQILITKWYTIFEVQPAFQSAWAGTQTVSPKPDLEVMQALMDAFYELKDSMPAKYNFWGALGSLAANGLKTFGSKLLKDLGGSVMKGMSSGSSSKKSKPKNSVKKGKNSNAIPMGYKPSKRTPLAIDQGEHTLNRRIDELERLIKRMSIRQPSRSNTNNGGNKKRSQSKRRSRSASQSRRTPIIEEVL
jgi:hypothetical protein